MCTRQSLDYTCLATGHDLATGERSALLEHYLELPAYADAVATLAELKEAGYRNYAFSNGEPDDLAILLANTGLAESLHGIVSVHECRSFKPDPSVYGFFLENTGALLGRTWLVSANPFDVIGALEVGWKAAWLQREPSIVFDPWEVEPTVTVGALTDLKHELF